MPAITKVKNKLEIDVPRLDGGLNKKDGPSKIDITESPDCLNVSFGDRGSVETREGTSYYNTSTAEIGSNVIDGLTEYKNTMVVWAGGNMYRVSGTTAVTVASAESQFASGTFVAYERYQDILFCSDGTNGPFRYEGGQSFYNMGITAPSAPTGASDTSGGGDIAADTYYYAVTYVNTHVVEGGIGSASVAVTLAASASVDVSSIPTGTEIEGVSTRNVYRATSATGPWLFVKELADNTTSSFSDNVAVGSEGSEPPDDGTAPTPFTTIKAHKERLWFDDSNNRTLLRYTNFDNPFVSEALNFLPLQKGDGSNITAIGEQNDFVTAFKANNVYVVAISDASDDTTFVQIKSPANVGVTGSRAFVETDNGIIFLGKRNGQITGVQFLSGFDVIQTQDQYLLSKMLSRKVEKDVLAYPSSLWDCVSMQYFDNRIYIGVPATASSVRIDGVLWFDVNRIVRDADTDPGSWAPWDGVVGVRDWAVLDGVLYGGSSVADGYILKFNNGTYTDADGSAINSYWWSKLIGGEPGIESWVKDWRHVVPWYDRLGSYFMNLKVRLDGSQEDGDSFQIDLTPGGSLWDTAVWDTDDWGGAIVEDELEKSVSPKLGKRIQVRFDNQNTAGQGFRVHSFKTRFNVRRQR